MAEAAKLLYILVEGDGDDAEIENGKTKDSYRYTRPVLQGTLQLMGCKARHAFKISRRVFELIRSECFNDALPPEEAVLVSGSEGSQEHLEKEDQSSFSRKVETEDANRMEKDNRKKSIPFELYKRRTTVVVRRSTFLDIVCSSLTEYKYVGPNQRGDLMLACRIREKKESVTVLLCGTSGCGKSTLSALLGSRLGITNVISTDSIRHMMRGFVDEKESPLVWASTYHAGEALDPVAVAEAKSKKKAKKLAHVSHTVPHGGTANGLISGKSDTRLSEMDSVTADMISPKQMAVEGFKAQSEMVIESLDRLITAWEERKESAVVEGVHLSLNFVMGLMKKHPSIIPFMIYIANEDKHLERFAVRVKYMTLDPAKNKYVKYIRNIRTIQEYLCHRADKHLVPKINNTNVDKSVAAIHATVFGCLRRREAGEQLRDPATNTVALVDEEYRNQLAANSLSSKGMFHLIQRKGSSRHLMALLNDDGSVAKAWPVESSLDSNGKPSFGHGMENGIGFPLYGPLKIGKGTEPVNLQFGTFGISAWPTDSCGTSHAGSVDESRAEGNEAGGSRYYSSCCSSPRMSDAPDKEPKEDNSVHGSDEEEVDDPPEVDSDEDLSDDDNKQVHEEMEGSVDEGSTKSDEEYDDLALQDLQENGGYWSDDDDDEISNDTKLPNDASEDHNGVSEMRGDIYRRNLDRFLQSRRTEALPDSPCSYSSLISEQSERAKLKSASGRVRIRRRSMSIPALRNSDPVMNSPICSGTPQS